MSDPSTNQSHATDPQTGSHVPEKAQEKLPRSVEENVPNKIHDTGSTGSKDHSTGHSYVPKTVAEALPKSVEEKVPDKVHDTSGKHS